MHPIDERGIPTLNYGSDATHDTWHWTNEINRSLLVTYIHSLEEDIACHSGQHGFCTCLLPCKKSIDYICAGLFQALYTVSLMYVYILSPIIHCSDYCNFIVSLDIGYCECSNFVLQVCDGCYRSFVFTKKF